MPATPGRRAVLALFTDAEFHTFVDTAAARAHVHGTVFVLGDSVRQFGDRAWGRILRENMVRVGLDDFASRIDLTDFDVDPLVVATQEMGRT